MAETKCSCGADVSKHDPIRLRACLLKSIRNISYLKQRLDDLEPRIKLLEKTVIKKPKRKK